MRIAHLLGLGLVGGVVVGCSVEEAPAAADGEISETSVISEALTTTSCVTLRRGTSAVSDTYVTALLPNLTFGSAPVATVGPVLFVPNGERFALLKWELPATPANATIRSAMLTVEETVLTFGQSPLEAHRITSAWNESSTTWNGFRRAYDPAVAATVVNRRGKSALELDLTTLAKQWASGGVPNHGVLLTQDRALSLFHTSEARSEAVRPKLVVCYDTVTPPPVCTANTSESCYAGPAGTNGVGACLAGTRTCDATGSAWSVCTGSVEPSAELCGDGVDNDCNGLVDEGCVCTPNASESCYEGPAGTEGVGTCTAGTRTCNATGTAFSECTGSVVPAADSCGDGLDSNCNGVADEACVCTPNATSACYSGPAGTDGVGACRAGTRTCDASGNRYGACTDSIVPANEVCGDGVDNDCDGLVDEGCIGDRAWNDTNRNGVQDPGEAGVAQTVFLLRTESGALVSVATTNANGTYWFSNVPTGRYYIESVVPVGYAITSKSADGNGQSDNDFDAETAATDVFGFSNGTPTASLDIGLVPTN